MGLKTIQTSFIAGELSPNLFGRQDDQLLKLGAQEITNFTVRKTGTLLKRSGLQFVYDFGADECRLEEFRFASDQTLVLVFAPNKLYFASKQGLVMNGDAPYSISTPYAKEDLWSLSFSQNADVVTITSAKHPPRELRRYGGTDWRFVELETKPNIKAPSGLSGTATYPPFNPTDKDDKDPNEGTYDIIKAQYKVTAVSSEGDESEPSQPITVRCNYYITGATVELSWQPVSGASYYRVYRAVSGIYGFLGQTEYTSLSDTGSTPDGSKTPPNYKAPFATDDVKQIINIEVLDGGSGYYEDSSSSIKGSLYVSGLPMVFLSGGSRRSHFHQSMLPTKVGLDVTVISPTGSVLGEQKFEYEAIGHTAQNHTTKGVQNDKPVTYESCTINANAGPPKSSVTSNGAIRIPMSSIKGISSGCTIKIAPFTEGGLGESHSAWGDYLNPSLVAWPTAGGSLSLGFDGEYLNTAARFGRDVILDRWKLVDNTYQAKYKDVQTNSSGDLVSGITQVIVPLTITDSTGSGAKANGIAVDGVITAVNILSGGKNYTSPTVTAGGTGSGARFKATLSEKTEPEFPRCSGQFDQRRVFAGSLKNPLKLWMTNAGSQNLMTVHTPLQDDDRIEIVALASDADMIKHIVAMDSLILFTGSSELRVFSQTGGGLGPRNVAVRAQSYVGANNVQPVVAKNTIVYISARGAHPQGLNYTDASGLYMSNDLGVRCTHLFDGKNITDLALAKTPEQLLYAVSTDGTALVCNFLPEQRINAWSRLKTDGKIHSVCAVAEGDEDRVYFIVKRNISGVDHYYLECLAPSIYATDMDARCLDSYVEHTFDDPVDNITGLGHLNGKTVTVIGDGREQSPKVVENGKITLDEEASHFVIGIPYESKIVTIPMEYTSPETIMSIRNFANNIKIRVGYGGNIKCARYPMFDENDLYDCPRNCSHETEQNGDSVVLDVRVSGNWSYQSQLLFLNNDHKPLEIAAMLVDLGYLQDGRSSR